MEGMKERLEELIDITFEKKKRLQAILKMTSMQATAISEGDVNLLTSYIHEKQRHIDAIDELDERFTQIYDGDIRENLRLLRTEKGVAGGFRLYMDLKELIDEVQGLIREIYDIEKDNDIKAKKAMKELKRKIDHLQVGKKGYTAYNRDHIPDDGIFIDKKQ